MISNASTPWVLLGLCGLGVSVAAASAATAPAALRPDAPHNVPLWINSATPAGVADDSKRVSIAAFLNFKNEAALKNLIAQQSNPHSVHYGEYLTPEQFHQRFSPNAKDVAKVQHALQALGLVVEFTPDSGLYVKASGTVKQIKAAFGVSQNLYSYKGKTLRANPESPKLSPELAKLVSYVAGLDETRALLKPDFIRRSLDSSSATANASTRAAATVTANASPAAPPPPQTGTPDAFCSTYFGDNSATLSKAPAPYAKILPYDVCGYTPQQLRAAYGADLVTEDGSGVRVGIVDVYASPTIEHDANHYSRRHGLPQLSAKNFAQILPPGILQAPADDLCGPQGWYQEETLDVESVHSMAPKAFIVFSGWECTDPVNSPLYDLIDHHRVDIVTNSYSYGGEALNPDFLNLENEFFMQAAAEGMSLLFSTGDDGDLVDTGYGIASGTWDATSPYVTAVGGTSLALFNAVGDKNEWAWGTYRASLDGVTVSKDGKTIKTSGSELPFTFYAGSGGGPSLAMLAPDYQSNVSYGLSGFTTLADGETVPLGAPHRVTPDISMVADPYTGFLYGESYAVSGDPVLDSGCTPSTPGYEYCEEIIGGTSLSSPLFAGVLALVDQSRLVHHKKPVGLVNPALYGMIVGSPGDTTSPIIDVQAPAAPTAVLRTYLGDPTTARIVTMNSLPSSQDPSTVFEGQDSSYVATPGYDEATGLGTPYVPALIEAFDSL